MKAHERARQDAARRNRTGNNMKRHEQMGNSINTAAPSSKVASAQTTSPQTKSCASACSYASTNNVVIKKYEACYEKDL